MASIRPSRWRWRASASGTPTPRLTTVAIRPASSPPRKRAPTDTVAALVKEYVAKHVRVKQRGWREEERVLNVDVLPSWKDRSVKELTRRDVRALVAPIVDRGSPIRANRVLAIVRRMLNHGIRNDWLDANPASLIDNPAMKSRASVC